MAIFKCKMCGGTIEFNEGDSIGVCDSCGTKQTLPRLDSDRKTNLYDRANHFRRNNEFDKAMSIYENILNEDQSDAEAYWSIVLCRYGIEYVEDPATRKRVPTVNRAQFTSIFDDEDYKSALKNADAQQRSIYEDEAKTINEIQKGILEISAKEEPFDVFICYKETDANGRRTPDSVLATDLYHQLTNEGFKVFFSRITLEDKLGQEYEPYIFAALNSAKAMVVLGTKPEHFNAVWVKNEWSRYLALIKAGAKKTLIPAYRDMDPYDLPDEFSHLQAQDMSKLGFMQDLIRGIKKIVRTDEPKQTTVRETVVQQPAQTNTAPLLRRAFMFLEDSNWQSADEYCEKVLDLDPENAEAYLGKLMAELKVRTRDALKSWPQPYNDRNNYKKAFRFGNEKLKEELSGNIAFITERNENTRKDGIYRNAVSEMWKQTEAGYRKAAALFASIPDYKDASKLHPVCEANAEESIYQNAVKTMDAASTASAYKSAAATFKTIPGFKDALALADRCLEQAEICRKDAVYSSAQTKMKEAVREITEAANSSLFMSGKRGIAIKMYETAINTFRTIPGWKDADDQISICQRAIEEIKAKEEADRLERERKEEEARIAEEKAAKKRKKIAAIVIPIIVACIAFVIVLTTVIIPKQKLNKAMGLLDSGDYETAYALLEEIGNSDAIASSKYERAVALIESGNYDTALLLLDGLNYKDSAAQIEKCITAFIDEKYAAAVELYNAGKYEDAITAFTALDGYKDSAAQIEKCETAIKDGKYAAAVELFNAGKYEEAIAAFTVLDGYKDSADYMNSCYIADIFGAEAYLQIKSLQAGDIFTLGTYEQDNNTVNGKEEIEWIVLARVDNRVFVISKNALDYQPYNTSYVNVTWETCSLRKWLNTVFFNAAFSVKEQKCIMDSEVTADNNPSYNTTSGNNTTDKIFLLSITEVDHYLPSLSTRLCIPTEYTEAQGPYDNQGAYYNEQGFTGWWLRTPGSPLWNTAATVAANGSVVDAGYYVDGLNHYNLSEDNRAFPGPAVRPAMWINLGTGN